MTAGLEIFAKVRALHDQATIPGEKAAAMTRMQTLARKAGMSVEEAVSKLDAPDLTVVASASFESAGAFSNAFSDFFNTPKMRAERVEREAKRLAKCAELLKRYGTEDAVFADTEREAALRQACAPLTVWDKRPDWRGSYTLAGWGGLGSKESMPPAVRDAVSAGWPLPETVAAAWAEYEAAEAHDSDRYAFSPDYTAHRWIEARGYVLEDMLDTLPAKSLVDMRARLSWMEHLNGLGCQWTHDTDALRLTTLRADIERMGERIREQDAEAVQSGQGQRGGETPPHPGGSAQSGRKAGGVSNTHRSDRLKPQQTSAGDLNEGSAPDAPTTVQSGHPRRTNADKRRDVLALLDVGKSDNARLTDREIARRAGVSPTTVGTIRRSLE